MKTFGPDLACLSPPTIMSFFGHPYIKQLGNGSPVLAFYVTYTMFVHHWKSSHRIKDRVENEAPNDMLTYDEQSALWYMWVAMSSGRYQIK